MSEVSEIKYLQYQKQWEQANKNCKKLGRRMHNRIDQHNLLVYNYTMKQEVYSPLSVFSRIGLFCLTCIRNSNDSFDLFLWSKHSEF